MNNTAIRFGTKFIIKGVGDNPKQRKYNAENGAVDLFKRHRQANEKANPHSRQPALKAFKAHSMLNRAIVYTGEDAILAVENALLVNRILPRPAESDRLKAEMALEGMSHVYDLAQKNLAQSQQEPLARAIDITEKLATMPAVKLEYDPRQDNPFRIADFGGLSEEQVRAELQRLSIGEPA